MLMATGELLRLPTGSLVPSIGKQGEREMGSSSFKIEEGA